MTDIFADVFVIQITFLHLIVSDYKYFKLHHTNLNNMYSKCTTHASTVLTSTHTLLTSAPKNYDCQNHKLQKHTAADLRSVGLPRNRCDQKSWMNDFQRVFVVVLV